MKHLRDAHLDVRRTAVNQNIAQFEEVLHAWRGLCYGAQYTEAEARQVFARGLRQKSKGESKKPVEEENAEEIPIPAKPSSKKPAKKAIEWKAADLTATPEARFSLLCLNFFSV